MARKCDSERIFPGKDMNTLYFREFQDIMAQTFGNAYMKSTFITHYSAEKIQELKGKFIELAGELIKDMNEESLPIDCQVTRAISGYYERASSLDWSVIENMKELYTHIHELNDNVERRLIGLKAGLF